MPEIIEFFQNLTDPQWIMQHGGLYLVLLIVFAETGLFVGFFLPGDPLLFITGIIIAHTGTAEVSSVTDLIYWVLLISASGIVGNYVGYWFGKRSGTMLMEKKDTWYFKRKYLHQAHDFFEKRGGGAIIIARFLPIVRTFAPIVAGVVGMDRKKFSFYNIVGSFIWVGSIVTAGYLLGDNEWVKGNLEYIIFGIIGFSTAPVLFKVIASKFSNGKVVPAVVEMKQEQQDEKTAGSGNRSGQKN